MVSRVVGRALLEIDRLRAAARAIAAQPDIAERADRRTRGHTLEAAVAQDRGFQRELRRDADAHLLVARRLSGFVVEDGVAAVGQPFDAVGARTQREFTSARADL